MNKMNLYIDDLERILALSRTHETLNRKFGITPLCTMTALDTNGNRLGTIEQDPHGKTVFVLADFKK
jgi:hypothetical protein